MSSSDICVIGAGGVVGRRVCRELAAAGVSYVTCGRRRVEDERAADTRVADAFDSRALAAAFAGVRCVINAAGPLRETAAPVLVGALSAGAHYVDVGGEQAVMQALYERHDSTARRAGLIALPGAGLDCVLGDLAAAYAAAHLIGASDDGPSVRREPAPRLADDHPLDEVTVSYVFDDLSLSAGSQRALFGAAFQRALVWRRDRWEPGRAGDARRVNARLLGGERDAIALAGGDVMTVPRHVAANLVATYLSTTRSRAGSTVFRLVATALPFVPRIASEVLAPYAPPEEDLARATFAVIVQARRGFSAAQIAIRGDDPYRTTAAITAWCARQLLERNSGPLGIRAPGELFRAAPALRELAEVARLVIEPSFGNHGI
jgi:short subunit dehydrogenase-like uncharacterized protein